MDKGDVSYCVQKLIKYDISENQKKLAKHWKHLDEALFKYEKREQQTKRHNVQLKDVSQEMEELRKTIEKQLRIEEEQKAEMIRLRQQLKMLSETVFLLRDQVFSVPQEDAYRDALERMCLTLIKMCTRIYRDPTTPEHIFRGFAAAAFNDDLFPFYFDARQMPAEHVTQKLWDFASSTSEYSNDWEKLFGG